MFKLPIVDQLYGLVMGLLGMTTVFVVIAYFVGKAITVQKENVDYERPNFSFVKREKDKFNLGGIDKGIPDAHKHIGSPHVCVERVRIYTADVQLGVLHQWDDFRGRGTQMSRRCCRGLRCWPR